ncbi:sugar phosphate isomerase/epimerase [candidate division KSB1 bacterium]|nr:sugar phosphate isomerase/epimerase [candidate division KSB1 bacterium]
MNDIGIMQGRLSPPTNGKFQSFPKYTWRDEFHKSRECDLTIIEWIFEADEWEKNPISSDDGIHEIQDLSAQTGIRVVSVCADYFMDLPLLRVDAQTAAQRIDKLLWLMDQSKKLGVHYINIPFVDRSAITTPGELTQVADYMRSCAEQARSLDILLCLETSLNPEQFKNLLGQIDHPFICANYDIGNSASLGYRSDEEFYAYGLKIKTLHIKDRVLHGGTVPLGEGNADFDMTFEQLRQHHFAGPIIFQSARGQDGDEVRTIKSYIHQMQSYLKLLE